MKWTYELIWKYTYFTSLALSRLNLIIHGPCPRWSPCSTTVCSGAFKRTKPSLTPFFDSRWHPTMALVTCLAIIYLIYIYNAFPEWATTENCTFHNFSVIISKRNFSWVSWHFCIYYWKEFWLTFFKELFEIIFFLRGQLTGNLGTIK